MFCKKHAFIKKAYLIIHIGERRILGWIKSVKNAIQSRGIGGRTCLGFLHIKKCLLWVQTV